MHLIDKCVMILLLGVMMSPVWAKPQSWQAIKVNMEKHQVGHSSNIQHCYVEDAAYLSLTSFKYLKSVGHSLLSKNGSLQWLGNTHQVIVCDDLQHVQQFN